jgi:hypothetical protein
MTEVDTELGDRLAALVQKRRSLGRRHSEVQKRKNAATAFSGLFALLELGDTASQIEWDNRELAEIGRELTVVLRDLKSLLLSERIPVRLQIEGTWHRIENEYLSAFDRRLAALSKTPEGVSLADINALSKSLELPAELRAEIEAASRKGASFDALVTEAYGPRKLFFGNDAEILRRIRTVVRNKLVQAGLGQFASGIMRSIS